MAPKVEPAVTAIPVIINRTDTPFVNPNDIRPFSCNKSDYYPAGSLISEVQDLQFRDVYIGGDTTYIQPIPVIGVQPQKKVTLIPLPETDPLSGFYDEKGNRVDIRQMAYVEKSDTQTIKIILQDVQMLPPGIYYQYKQVVASGTTPGPVHCQVAEPEVKNSPLIVKQQVIITNSNAISPTPLEKSSKTEIVLTFKGVENTEVDTQQLLDTLSGSYIDPKNIEYGEILKGSGNQRFVTIKVPYGSEQLKMKFTYEDNMYPLQCDETEYQKPGVGFINGILDILDVGLLQPIYLYDNSNVVVVDSNFPTKRISINDHSPKKYNQGTLTNGVLTIPTGTQVQYTVEGWANDTEGQGIRCQSGQRAFTEQGSSGIRIQKAVTETTEEELIFYVHPKFLSKIPKEATLTGAEVRSVDEELTRKNNKYAESTASDNAYYKELVLTYQTPGGKEIVTSPVVARNTPYSDDDYTSFWEIGEKWKKTAGLWWGKLWRPKTTYPETMPTLPPELATAISQVLDENWKPLRDTGIEWDDKFGIWDKDDIDQFNGATKTEDKDGNKIKANVTGETKAQTAWVEYTDAEGQARRVKVIRETTTSVYTSQEDNSPIKAVEYEMITVKEKGETLYVDTHTTTTYPISADGTVSEKVEEERSFEDYAQEIETHQRTGDDDKPYQVQYWAGTTDVSVGAGVMEGLPTLRFYDEKAPGNLLAVGALVGGEVRTPWHYMMAVDLAILGQTESYSSSTGSTELSVPWQPVIRPYWTFFGYSSQSGPDDTKNNWSVGLTLPQTYFPRDFLSETTPVDGHMTYGSTDYRVTPTGRWPWFVQGAGIRGRWFPGDQQKYSLLAFLTLEEQFGSIYGNYQGVEIHVGDEVYTNPPTATTAYGAGAAGAIYFMMSLGKQGDNKKKE